MQVDNRDIFEQLGNAFYAIAADQQINSSSMAVLKQLVANDWLPGNDSSVATPGMMDANCIFTTMDSLQEEHLSASLAFNSFQNFFQKHPEVFTNDLRKMILTTSSAIVRRIDHRQAGADLHFQKIKKLLQINEPISN